MRIIGSKEYFSMNTDGYIIVDKIYFTIAGERDKVLQACNGDVEVLEKLFSIIGVKYDKIEVCNNRDIYYYIGELRLSLDMLSSGERTLLYMLSCKILNKKLIAEGLLERLGERLTNVLVEQFKDYDLTIVMYGNALRNSTIPFYS